MVLRHLRFHIAQAALHFLKRFEHALQLLPHGAIGSNIGLLRKHPHAAAAHQRNRALVRLHHARNQPEQRGFAAAVHADQTHAAVRLQGQTDVLQHRVHREGFGNVLYG